MNAIERRASVEDPKASDWRLRLLQEGWCGAAVSQEDVVIWEMRGTVLAIGTRYQLNARELTDVLSEAMRAGQTVIGKVEPE